MSPVVLRVLGVALALLLVVLGVLWTGQGLGWFDDGSTSSSTTWSVLGPLVAGIGVALGFTVLRPRS